MKRLNYFIFSEKRMYSTAVKMMLDELRIRNKIFEVFSELKDELSNSTGTVVIIGPNSIQDPYELGQEVSRLYPLTAVVLLLDKGDIDYKRAMYSGVVDVIDIDGDEEEVVQSIKKAEKVVNIKLKREQGLKEDENEAKVVTICSTKGGVGKTTITVNLATALYKNNLKIVVLDLDLQFGDVALLFDQQPSQTIYDWVKQSYENGDKSYNKFLLKNKLGVDILAAPTLPEFSELIKGEHISYLIDVMKKEYDIIVIDTPPAFIETSLVAFEYSDIILLIASLDLPALKNGKLATETLKVLGLEDKIKVVLNRDSEMEGMTKELAESVLGNEISSKIPSDYRTVISSINKGEPFVTHAPRTPVTKSIMLLAEQIINSFPKEQIRSNIEKKKKGMFFFNGKNRR